MTTGVLILITRQIWVNIFTSNVVYLLLGIIVVLLLYYLINII